MNWRKGFLLNTDSNGEKESDDEVPPLVDDDFTDSIDRNSTDDDEIPELVDDEDIEINETKNETKSTENKSLFEHETSNTEDVKDAILNRELEEVPELVDDEDDDVPELVDDDEPTIELNRKDEPHSSEEESEDEEYEDASEELEHTTEECDSEDDDEMLPPLLSDLSDEENLSDEEDYEEEEEEGEEWDEEDEHFEFLETFSHDNDGEEKITYRDEMTDTQIERILDLRKSANRGIVFTQSNHTNFNQSNTTKQNAKKNRIATSFILVIITLYIQSFE